jgi:hypothetical protein
MTGVQVFKWFCKEQKIMPLMRQIYYAVRPTDISWKAPLTYISFDEYIKTLIENYGFGDLLIRLENAYYFKIGWDKYEKFSRENNFVNLNRKWYYFTNHNIFINEDSLKVGSEVEFVRPLWNFGNHINDDDYIKSTIIQVNPDSFSVRLNSINEDSYKNYSTSISNLRYVNTHEPLKINFYIKRKGKKYYGINRE